MKPLVEQTHTWNSTIFKKSFDSQNTSIIKHNSEDIGMLKVQRHDDFIYLADILIKPEFQNRGLGTSLILELISEAKQKNIPLKLRVLRVNPVRSLYDRLGFTVVAEDEYAVFMVIH
ncbi:GNAT family N-acetyltransferase [Rubritalea tangerina]|uniref:GNAT family N-acetyltransferase n=2 Tax=Rubritalea tangerina TaxID=430798 RepID=A0ABW4Z8Q8_9BACT